MKRIAAFGATMVVAGALAGCGGYTPPAAAEPEGVPDYKGTDPKKGWVLLWDEPETSPHDEISMRCRGKELLYQADDNRGSSWSSPVFPNPACE